jgi:hypothetical protein
MLRPAFTHLKRNRGFLSRGMTALGSTPPNEETAMPRPNRQLPQPRAVIVAPQPEAVEAGATILDAGGNALDALIACALTQGVVDPMMCGWAASACCTCTIRRRATGGLRRALDLPWRLHAGHVGKGIPPRVQ